MLPKIILLYGGLLVKSTEINIIHVSPNILNHCHYNKRLQTIVRR